MVDALVKKDVSYQSTLIKHKLQMLQKWEFIENKSRFLFHLFFLFIEIVIIIFLCYHKLS